MSSVLRVFLGGLGGLGVFASLPPRGWWPVAPVGMALLALALRDASWRWRMAVGATAGAVWFGLGLVWMVAFTLPGYLLAVVIEVLLVALATVAVPPRRGRMLAVPAVLVVLAAVSWRWPFGGFPLAALTHGQAGGPLLPVASLGGPLAITAVIAAVAAALAGVAERRVRTAATALAVAVLTVGAAVLLGPGDVRQPLRVAIVQGGGERGIPGVVADEQALFDRHLAAVRTIERPVDLALLPENVVHVDGPVAGTSAARRIGTLARSLDATVVVGVIESVGSDRFRNAAVAWGPDGRIVGRVEKVRRVPFGEYVPARALVSRFADVSLVPRDAIPGPGPAVLDTPAGELGVAISYEVFFPGRVRRAARGGAGLLLVPTNAASFTGPEVPAEEVAAVRLRAVETGRWLLQAAPTGYSAIIGPHGDVVSRSNLEDPAILTAEINRRTGSTVYARTGDGPVLLLATILLAAAWITHGRHSRVPHTCDADGPVKRR